MTYNYVVNTGTIIPDTSTTKDEVIAEFREIFGQDFIVDDETPEGAWINAETLARQAVARNNSAVANQINPSLSGGSFLDSLWSLTGGQRTAQTRSVVNATMTGIAGTIIPAGAQARSGENIFFLVNSAVIGTGGSVTAEFNAMAFGQIECPANSLTAIVNAVLGWETVTNAAAATLGLEQESDQRSKFRRRNELALIGRSIAFAVRSNVSAVPGVRSLTFRENEQNIQRTIDGIVLKPNSIWACIDGGADTGIGAALLRSKTGGTDWNGAQSVVVMEPESGQQYTVNFDRPTNISMLFRVTVRAPNTVSDPETSVRTAILNYAVGNVDNYDGFVVGADVSPFEVSAAVVAQIPGLYVMTMEVAPNTGGNPVYQTTTFDIALNQIASTAATQIQVVVQ